MSLFRSLYGLVKDALSGARTKSAKTSQASYLAHFAEHYDAVHAANMSLRDPMENLPVRYEHRR